MKHIHRKLLIAALVLLFLILWTGVGPYTSGSAVQDLTAELTALHGEYHGWEPRVTEENMRDFLISSLSRTGAETMITPREIIRDYVTLLDLLYTNGDKTFADIAGTMPRTTAEDDTDEEDSGTGDEKKTITIEDLEF